MSYILEALRRAETERERKRRVPGLHAQPVVAPPEEPGAHRSKAWLWMVVGVSAGVLPLLVWRSWPSDPATDEAAGARVAVAGSVATHGAAAAADAPAAPPASVATPAAGPAPTRPAAAAAPSTQAAQTTAKAAAAAKPGAARTQPERAARPPATAAATNTTTSPAAPSQGARPAPAAAIAAAPAPASAPEPPLRSLAELPEELRRGVPQLAFGGSVYSEIAAQRMVIFNGQVLREGDAVTDDLLLEQIRPRSAVMRVRGQRFEVAF